MDAAKIDVDALFKQYSIKEIQSIELQIKNEIEKKKEDLRIMVYNRYRDIIEAADGIHVMKSCSKEIENVLTDLQSICVDIFNDKENTEFKNQDHIRSMEKSKRNNKYIMAVIIKILQNSPSKIWYHLDNDEYTKAAKQYLLAQHAHICLELEKPLKSFENASNFIQYANELWTSIVFLSKTITTKARSTFQNSNIESSKLLSDAISAIYLLENINLKQIFHEFISNRIPLISSTLSNEASDQSIKHRIIDCLKVFVNSVNHLYNLFSSDTENKSESFEDQVDETSFTIETLKDDGFVISKIPSYLKNVKFKEGKGIKRFETSYLNEQASTWLETCLNEIKAGMEKTFKYANSIKSLVTIRDAVIEFETKIQSDLNNQLTWSKLCESLFNKQINIWTQIISSFYYFQSKLIIETSFSTIHENLFRNVSDCLLNKTFEISNDQKISPEVDINSYLWSLDQSSSLNINSNIDFISSQANKSFSNLNRSTNSMNQHIITPIIEKLCNCLDEDLNCLQNDIEFTTNIPLSSANQSNANIANIINEEFKCFNEYLLINLQNFSEKLCQTLLELIKNLNEQIEQKLNSDTNLNVKKLLLIVRFAYSLIFFCPQLKICFLSVNQQSILQRQMLLNSKLSLNNDAISSTIIQLTKKKKTNEQKNLNEDQNWSKLTSKLKDITKSGFKVWIEYLCRKIKETHLSKLSLNLNENSNSPKLAIEELIAWDEIEIEDELNVEPEGEEDNQDSKKSFETKNSNELKSIKSKLNVPLVCSSLVQSILYTISQELTKNLSYNLIDSNLIVKDLVFAIFDLILNSYIKIIDDQSLEDKQTIKLTQNQALQMLFDLKFIYNLFDLKSHFMSMNQNDANKSSLTDCTKLQDEFKEACAKLESFVDPFDYDICTPFIQSNISKSIGRCSMLYGVLNINERLTRSTTAASSTMATANEKYNLLILSTNQHRFELLPLASQQQQQQQQLIEKQSNIQSKNQINNMKIDETFKKSNKQQSTADFSGAGLFGFKWFQ